MPYEKSQYNSSFCPPDTMPEIGSVCPKCGKGEIRQSKFFEGVYCSECRWGWRKSKWGDKKETKPQIETLEIIEKLNKLHQEHKLMDEKLNKLLGIEE